MLLGKESVDFPMFETRGRIITNFLPLQGNGKDVSCKTFVFAYTLLIGCKPVNVYQTDIFYILKCAQFCLENLSGNGKSSALHYSAEVSQYIGFS